MTTHEPEPEPTQPPPEHEPDGLETEQFSAEQGDDDTGETMRYMEAEGPQARGLVDADMLDELDFDISPTDLIVLGMPTGQRHSAALIDANRVQAIVGDCLFAKDEDTTCHVRADGILHTFGFHPERLMRHRAEVAQMLHCLPIQFQPKENGGGGGWTFLNACEDKDGNLWTGFQSVVEQLLCLGIAMGLCHYVMPKEMWGMLPGSMPYFVIDPDVEDEVNGNAQGEWE